MADSELEEDPAVLEAELVRLRAENAALADRFRASPSPELREELKRAAARLHEVRDRLEALRAPASLPD